ncbi:MAG: alanine:cation symporter family protein [Clostridia bacterium]|nr:alanine:cation symporter family protein [Clostridia bacterium]
MSVLTLLPIIVTLGGAFFLFKLRFFFFLHPIRIARATRAALSSREARRSLFLALAGTLGVGNIVGVAVGITVGGAGSVLWLLVSSLFASVLKYAESTLASDMRRSDGGGMLPVISATFGKGGKTASVIYAILCVALSFVMGAALQTASVVTSATEALSVPAATVAAVFTAAVFLVIARGAEKIERFTAIIMPITTALYIVLCLATVVSNMSRIPAVISSIFASALSLDGIRGGIFATVAAVSVREGFCRGLLSNEAGAGTSAFAHSAKVRVPTDAGLLGMCEVFFDTVVLCMLTAISILLTVDNPAEYTTGMSLVLDSVGSIFGSLSRHLVVLAVTAFAFSTVICWYFYGSRAMYSASARLKHLYTALFLFSVFFGGMINDVLLVHLTDFILLALTAITVLTLIKNSDRLCHLSECSGLINPRF